MSRPLTTFVLVLICFPVAIASVDSQDFVGDVGPPLTIVWKHADSLLVAKCGIYQSSTITADYEYPADFPRGQQPEKNRTFGAYAVANFNDSDSDGADSDGNPKIRDVDDNDIHGGGRVSEVDLIKLTIEFPAHYQASGV